MIALAYWFFAASTFVHVGCAPPASEPRQSLPGVTLFEGARLLVGDGSTIDDSAFLVENNTIAKVGRKGELSVPDGVTRVDLSGKTVMPALISAHAHLGYEKFVNRSAENYNRESLVDHLNRYAYYGVGAVLSLGTDPIDLALQLQRDSQAGQTGGARYVYAAGMGPTGGGPGSLLPLVRATGAVYQVANEEEARKTVREVTAKGAKLVKIWVDDRGGTQPKLQPAVYRAIIDEAHKNGARVIAHPGTESKALLRAGVDGLAHMQDVDDEFVMLTKERNVFVTPNVWAPPPGPKPWFEDPFLQDTFSPSVASQVNQRLGESLSTINPAASRAAREQRARALAKLTAAGVRVLLGTDAGALRDRFFGYNDHLELEEWVHMGMTPGQAIVAATKTTAEALELNEMGTVAPGKSADFVVLDANPLDNIANTRRIASVYLRGKAIDRAGLRTAWRSH